MLDCEPALSSDGDSLKLYIFGSGLISVQLVAHPPKLCVALQGVPAGAEREGLTCPIFLYQVECERFSEEDLARKGE